MQHLSPQQHPNLTTLNNTTPEENTTTTTTTESNPFARRLAKFYPQSQRQKTQQKQDPLLLAKIYQLSLPLAPLAQVTTGQIHPSFPRTLLAFWLLTSTQLDDLAHFYHQSTPGPWTSQYPCPVFWKKGMGIEEKRRKLGSFIGLRERKSPLS